MNKRDESFNYNIPSFWKGFASAFDVSGQTFKFPDFTSGFDRDRLALSGDWQKIGNDLRKSMAVVAHEQ